MFVNVPAYILLQHIQEQLIYLKCLVPLDPNEGNSVYEGLSNLEDLLSDVLKNNGEALDGTKSKFIE